MTKNEFLERERIFKNILFQNEYGEENLTVEKAFYNALTEENPPVSFQEILDCHPVEFANITIKALQRIPSDYWNIFWKTADQNLNCGEITAVAVKLLCRFRSDENHEKIEKKALRLLEKFSTENELHEEKIQRDYQTIFKAFFEEAMICPEILKKMSRFLKNACKDGAACDNSQYQLLLRSCEDKVSPELVSAVCAVMQTDCLYSHDICKVLLLTGRLYYRLKKDKKRPENAIDLQHIIYDKSLKIWNIFVHSHSLRKVITALLQIRQNRQDPYFYEFFDSGFTVKMLKLALDHRECKQNPGYQKILMQDCLNVFSHLLDTEKDDRWPENDFLSAKEGKHLLTKILCREPQLAAEIQKTAVKCLEVQKGKKLFKEKTSNLQEEKSAGEKFSSYPIEIKNFITGCHKLGICFD